jgi:hypothetical protein
MNVISANRHSSLLDSVTQTIGSVFPNVNLAVVPNSRNYLLVAGNNSILLHSDWLERFHFPAESLSTIIQLEPVISPTAPIFTDNWAPVEYLTEHEYLQSN